MKTADEEFPPAVVQDENTRAPVSWQNLAFIATVANLGSLLFGYDFGATSWLLTRIAQYGAGFDDDQYRVFIMVAKNAGLTGFIAAGSSIGATITFVFLLFFGNGIPKNDEIMLSALLYFMGALLESSSGDVSWRNYIGLGLLIGGRLLYGAGIALSFHSVPQYISEISPRVGRGSIGSLTEAMTVTGVVLGFLVGYLDQDGSGFVVTFRVGYLIAIVMGMLAMILPRSPSWLVRKGADDEEILESLQFIRPAATLESVADLRKSIAAYNSDKQRWQNKLRKMDADPGKYPCATRVKTPEVKLLFVSRTLRQCLTLALILVFLQQFSGQGAIVYYSGKIFDEICPDYASDCVIGFGMVKLFAVCVMVFVADLRGRRQFLIGGTTIMLLGLIALCVGLAYDYYTLALVGIYISVAANEASLATLLWVVLSEVFPQFVRSAAISIAVATFFAWASLVTFILPFMEEYCGLLGVFVMYTVAAAVSVVLLYLFVPETRGVDLEVAYKLVNVRVKKSINCFSKGVAPDGVDTLPVKETGSDDGSDDDEEGEQENILRSAS